MPVRVLLVRHCQSAVDPTAAPSTWGLSDVGLEQARSLEGSLAGTIGDAPAVVAGSEPKLVQSLEPLAAAVGSRVATYRRLDESRSAGWLGDQEFLSVVRRFLEKPSAPPASGWETASATATRFVEAVDEVADGLPSGAAAVVCSGGRALTATLGHLGLVARSELFLVWRDLRMPDVAELEWRPNGRARLVAAFGATG